MSEMVRGHESKRGQTTSLGDRYKTKFGVYCEKQKTVTCKKTQEKKKEKSTGKGKMKKGKEEALPEGTYWQKFVAKEEEETLPVRGGRKGRKGHKIEKKEKKIPRQQPTPGSGPRGTPMEVKKKGGGKLVNSPIFETKGCKGGRRPGKSVQPTRDWADQKMVASPKRGKRKQKVFKNLKSCVPGGYKSTQNSNSWKIKS